MKRLVVLAASLLAGCGTTDQVAGGGSDQPNKVWAGRVLADSTGTVAAEIQVQSWSGAWDPLYSKNISNLVDSGRSDVNGAWSLHVPDTGAWFVVAKLPGKIAVFTSGSSDTLEILQTTATYKGCIRAATGLQLEAVWLGGSGGAIAPDADGNFTVTTKPGAYRLWARVRWSGGTDTILVRDRILVAGGNVDTDTLIADTGITLLASAQSSPLRSALRGVDFPAKNTDAAQWFSTTDKSISGTSSILPVGFATSPDSAVVVDPNGRGRHFSWQFSLGSAVALKNGDSLNPYAAVGLNLSRRELDWSGVRALRIVVRGTGRIKLQLNTSTAADRLGQNNQFQFAFALSQDWTTIDVPLADSMHAPNQAQADSMHMNWSAVQSGVQQIAFYTGSRDAHLELLEIRAIGSRVSNW